MAAAQPEKAQHWWDEKSEAWPLRNNMSSASGDLL